MLMSLKDPSKKEKRKRRRMPLHLKVKRQELDQSLILRSKPLKNKRKMLMQKKRKKLLLTKKLNPKRI